LMVEASMDAFREPDAAGDSLMQILDACLAKLPDWERVLLLLRSQDMPYTEIARYVHKPAEQLKVYHQRAKTKLEKLVEEALTSVNQE
jgi:DNA-directed RNA polymerase specialized sigma24 family protein